VDNFLDTFAEFRADSWSGWRKILRRLTPDVREFVAICGRGAGKSRIVAAIACYFATQREFKRVVGERIYIGVIAPDRKQASVTLGYIKGLLASVPTFATLIEAETSDSIDLANGITIEVVTATISAPRGRAYALVIIEEAAFLRDEQSANPDIELVRAVTPALARVPGSLLCVISSPYARRGYLYQAWKRHQTSPSADVLLVQAPTLELNPSFDRRAIHRAYAEDPAAAAAEYGAQFRSDVETFVSMEALDACVQPGRHELAPIFGWEQPSYAAFVDPSGGSADGFTLAIGHRVDERIVIDALRETQPPFSPEAVISDYAALLKQYRITTVTGDRYAGEFPREAFRKLGVTYETSAKSKSELYRDLLPMLNSHLVELLDHPKAIQQLATLERRTARGGKDSIDHAPGSHDDLANVVAGLCAGTDLATDKARGDWVMWPSPQFVIEEASDEEKRRYGYLP
jgi:hypothetical protein